MKPDSQLKTPHSGAGHYSAQTIELKIVSFNDYESETKTGSENKWDVNFILRCFHLKGVYFLSHYPATAWKLRDTVKSKSLSAHQIATIYPFVSLRLKFNLPGRLMSGLRHSCDPKDTGYPHRGTFMLLVRADKAAALLGNVVMHFL